MKARSLRKRAEERLSTQHAVTRVLAEAATLAEATPEILEAICKNMGWEIGAIWEVDRDTGGALRCVEVWHPPSVEVPEFEAITRQSTFALGVGLPGRVWASGEPTCIADVVQDPNFPRAPYAVKEGLHGAFAFPIRLGSNILGVIEFFSREIRPPDEELLQIFAAIGSQIGQFIERKRDEAALRQSESRKGAILETALDCIITIDHEGRIVEWNPAAEKTFGYRREEALGQEMGALIVPPSLREAHRRGLAHYLATGEGPVLNQRIEILATRADGTEFPVELAITRIHSNGPPMFTGFVRDITPRKQLEKELQQRAEALAKADRAKDQFLAMLAHELRNPLPPVLNAFQLLKLLGPTEPRLVRALEIIERQVKHQADLIDDLLNVSRIARGKIALRRERLDLIQLLRDIAEDYRTHLEAAGLALSLEMPGNPGTDPQRGCWVEGDPTRLAQVVGNLLNNAAKFTNRGGQVTVRLEADPVGPRVAVTVRDTGIGIEPEMLPHVFETFSQADRSLDRSQGGLGLGLALVKGLIELHGGEVRAASEGVGRGAEFTVLLPSVATDAAPDTVPASAPLPAGPLRILIVEDNQDTVETLRDLLELSGCTVGLAYSGPEAVEVAREFRPEVVLCDLGLPGMDGYQVAAALRREPAAAGARLIAVSGYGREEDRRRSHAAGFDLHLTKPVDFVDLRRLLEVTSQLAAP